MQIARSANVSAFELLIVAYALGRGGLDYEELELSQAQIDAVDQKLVDLAKFTGLIELFGSVYFDCYGEDVSVVLDTIIRKTKYIDFVNDGSDAGFYRKENVEELVNVASSYAQREGDDSLSVFLSDIALIQERQDEKKDLKDGSITLMTLHSSKGLEFPVVFMVGLEEGLLPHSRTFTEPAELEEERRLCYVGITRAQEKLIMSFAQTRRMGGGLSEQIPSRFLAEIPQDICDYYSWEY